MARSLRQDTEVGLRELADADWDETSEVARVAADTAARTLRRMSQPDSDGAPPPQWHQKPAAKVAAVVSLLGALGALLEALRQVGALP